MTYSVVGYVLAGLCLIAAIVAVRLWRADNKRTALWRAKAEHANRLLRYIKQVHQRGTVLDWEGFPLCAECGDPHPCDTFRAASGDEGYGWERYERIDFAKEGQ